MCLPVLAYFLFILLLAKYTCSEDDKKPMMSFNNSRDFPSQKNHFPSTRPSESTCYIKGKRTGFPRGLTHYFAKKAVFTCEIQSIFLECQNENAMQAKKLGESFVYSNIKK